MNHAIPITKDISWVGANDRDTQLFEGLWPIPRGVSYNAYVINDEKVALVDTVKGSSFEKYLSKIREALGGRRPDYLIVNHMEPDHSGSMLSLLEVFPEIKIIGNNKTTEFINNFYRITKNIHVVGDGDVLDLGRHKLKFFITPMIHWPETMVTYDTEDKVLFSGDAFGGFGALDGGIFDDEVDIPYFEDEILRYFSNIIGKYCAMVEKAIAKVSSVDIGIVASTHGPVWRKNPAWIIDKYSRWSRHEAEEGVVIVYASMYGNTEKMMEAVASGLAGEDVSKVRIHNASSTHVSYLIRDAWRFKALLMGSPTYDTNLHPTMEHFVTLLEHKKLSGRIVGVFGTCGWGGGGVKRLVEFAKTNLLGLIEPIIEAKCSPTDEDINNCVLLGRRVVEKIKMDPRVVARG